ncbi:MAG TPA: FAD:protein FMN transferase [Thermohalobaculum sp.]|nr:FAD:protein FMN transferase [Thermohalobaculum sp.]
MMFSRRRFMLAAVAAGTIGRVTPSRWEWRGSAMGAEARIVLDAPRDQAEAALAEVVADIDRLEEIFSLHRPGSQLSRLNAAGRLDAPARDLRNALASANRWARVTEGAFDPAVQPLWRAWAEGVEGAEEALTRVRGARIEVTPAGVSLSPGAALTLNGIAQGIVADRVAALLDRHGFAAPLIDTGEMQLPGPERRPVELPEAGVTVRLARTALATSAPSALTFDPAGRHHHLFDPRTGDSPGWWRSVTVIAPTAAQADALSTAFAVSPPDLVGDIAAGLPDIAVFATRREGEREVFGTERLIRESLA